MKIRPVGADFHADVQTDRHMTTLIVTFRIFANEPKEDRKWDRSVPNGFIWLRLGSSGGLL
jgi:hypothetical protein